MNPKPYLREVWLDRGAVPDFAAYPFDIPIIRSLRSIAFHPDVTFFVGENGTGKSTLIEAIAMRMGFSPEGGTKNVRLETAETTSSLYRYLKAVKSFYQPRDHYFLRAESFYNLATYMDSVGMLRGYGDKSLHQRSHGEAFMVTLNQKLDGCGLYIFDEPEAALSPTRQLAALTIIHRLVQHASQFIIATHSPILMAYPNAKILSLDGDELIELAYEDTEHFAVTKGFLNRYPAMLEELFAEELEEEG